MSRVWSCGFELQSLGAGVEISSPNGGSISTSVKRSGAASYRTNPTASSAFGAHTYSTGTGTTYYFRTYLYIAAYPTNINNDVNVLYPSNEVGIGTFITGGASEDFIVTLSSSGTIQLRDAGTGAIFGSASSALALNTWYRLEYKGDGGGAVDLKLDGVSLGSGTVSSAYGALILVAWGINPGNIYGETSTATADIYWDDLALNSDTGSFQNSWPGAGSIIHLHPNAAGDNNDWLHDDGSAGGANNYTEVLEVTPDDATSYVKVTATGFPIDSYNIQSAVGAGLTAYDIINVVQVGFRAMTTTTGAGRSIFLHLESAASSAKQFGGIVSISSTSWITNSNTSVKLYTLVSYTDPTTGVAWTPLGTNSLENAQIGTNLGSSNTSERRVSTLWLLVDYIPTILDVCPPITWGRT